MIKAEVFEILKVLKNSYYNFEITQEKIDTWHLLLKNDCYKAVMKNVHRHVLEKKFPPTIAEIKENRNPAYRNDILSKLEEWEKEASGKPSS